MRWSDIPFRPTTATLRWFAGFGTLFLAVLACSRVLLPADRALGLVLGGLALALGLLGLLAPSSLRPVYVGLMVLTYPLNWLTSHLILACLFYCVITPLGVSFRLIGRDVLTRRFRPDRDTYWAPKPRADDVRSYFRPS